MFSRKMLFFIGGLLFVIINFAMVTISSKDAVTDNTLESITISFISPFQMVISKTVNTTENVWQTYFNTVSAAEENRELRQKLAETAQIKNRARELALENRRLKKLVNFTSSVDYSFVAAQVIARDPSPWFKTIMIDKGTKDGLSKGLPVVVSEGVVGQIIKVAEDYARILLIKDRNSAVDALLQNSRVRGVVKGDNSENCYFRYALRKDEIKTGEMIISSGFDQVYPKGLKIGRVVAVQKENSQLFQKVVVKTSVDFDKLEEVLIALKTEQVNPQTDSKE